MTILIAKDKRFQINQRLIKSILQNIPVLSIAQAAPSVLAPENGRIFC